MTSRDRGEDAHVAPLRWNGIDPGGARLVVNEDPVDLLRTAVDVLVRSGFVDGGDAFANAIGQLGSEWVARDVRLGDITQSRKRSVLEFFTEGTGLEFFPRFWRGATPTLVVAAARSVGDASELVIYPHYSTRGGSYANDAAPLLRRTVTEIADLYRSRNRLVSSEKLLSLKNDGSPASQAVVREVLGWR